MKLLLFSALVAAIGISGCRNDIATPENTGTIAGRVILFDSTSAILTDFSGVRVSVDGSSNSTVTDALGAWQLSGVSEGLHDVSATRPGFGTYHWYGQNINSGRLDESTVGLASMPTYTPNISRVGYDSTVRYFYEVPFGTYSQLPLGVNIAGYCDLDSNVQPSDAHLMVAYNTDNTGGGGIVFSYNDLLAAGVRPGQTLYISAANVFVNPDRYSFGYQTTFFDPSHNNEMRYASTGPKSNVVACTMP